MLRQTAILRRTALKRTAFNRFAKPGALDKARAWLHQKRKPIRKVSAKKRKTMNTLAKIRREKIQARGNGCELVILGVCTGFEQGLHHIKKQSQGGENTHENTMLACNPCNRWVEDHPDEAAKMGLVERQKQVA